MMLDTSGLLALFHKDELQHGEAVRCFESARVRLTHNYVLAEFIPLATVRGFRRDQVIEFCRH
jgi:predicted nucleic acid-binding protein